MPYRICLNRPSPERSARWRLYRWRAYEVFLDYWPLLLLAYLLLLVGLMSTGVKVLAIVSFLSLLGIGYLIWPDYEDR
jgi:hypothetical protein